MARSTISLALAAAAGATASQHLPDNANELIARTRHAVAQMDLAHLSRSLTLEAIHGNQPPSQDSFGDYVQQTLIAPDGRDTSLDPWGGRYEVENYDDFSVVRSPGPDGRVGTGDDLVRVAPIMQFRLLWK